mgnify:CR=1 FL=1
MITINIRKSTIVAFSIGFLAGFTRKVYVEIKKAKKENEAKEN